ncbi:MAG: four helix bundle protein, partial [Bacteroidetes bacterium]|nr:four helix bundle protein [Bacteroidota bacterium]
MSLKPVILISRKEAKETRYFLRVISGTYIDPEDIKDDIREAEEIINILSSMINKS